MKYVVCVPDGCADEPVDQLGGRTPLEVAHLPTITAMAARGEVGRAEVIPPGLPPGSDVGNMSIFGYDPMTFHTGRAPIEAAALGLRLADDQVAYRCNLVTVADDTMVDFSGGHPSTEAAAEVVAALQDELGGDGIEFHPGVEYRHIMVAPSSWAEADLHAAPRPLRSSLSCWPEGPGRARTWPAHGRLAGRRRAGSASPPTRSGCGARARSPRCPPSPRASGSTRPSTAPSISCAASACSPTSRWSTSTA